MEKPRGSIGGSDYCKGVLRQMVASGKS